MRARPTPRTRRFVVVTALAGLAVICTLGATDCDVDDQPASSSEAKTSIPLTVTTVSGGTIVLVPVKINNHGPYNFILDTGASTTVIDDGLARRLRLHETGETVEINGVAGDTEAPRVKITRWTLGGKKLHGRSTPAFDLGIDPAVGRVYGLLGSDELRRFGAVRIDYKKRRLTLGA